MSIYGVSSFSHPFASQDLVSPGIPPLSKSDVQHFLDEPANTGETPDAMNALLPQNSNKEGVDFDEPQEGPRDRIALSMYFMQYGLYADVVGHSKDVSPLDGMTASYPPTVIIHGTADKVVPIEVSEQTVATLQSLGVTVKFIEVPGKDHDFEHFAHAKDKDGSKLWSTYSSSLYLFLDEVLALK
jgi:acetyl esterase/lipase